MKPIDIGKDAFKIDLPVVPVKEEQNDAPMKAAQKNA